MSEWIPFVNTWCCCLGIGGVLKVFKINNICTDQVIKKLRSQKATNVTRIIKHSILNRMYNCVVFMTWKFILFKVLKFILKKKLMSPTKMQQIQIIWPSKGGSYTLCRLLSSFDMPSFCVIYRGGKIYELRYCLCFNIKKENMYQTTRQLWYLR